MATVKSFDHYKVILYGGNEGQLARLMCYQDEAFVGRIDFYSDASSLPRDYLWHPNVQKEYIILHMPISRFRTVLSIVQKEEPLHLNINVDRGIGSHTWGRGQLSTSKLEPVGEEEYVEVAGKEECTHIVDIVSTYYCNPARADQGAARSADNFTFGPESLNEIIDTYGTTNRYAIVCEGKAAAGSTYTLTTSESVPSNIRLKIMEGAIFDGAGTLTLDSPEQLDVGRKQKIFGSSITVVFSNGGEVSADWWGPDGAGDQTEINKAVTSLANTAKKGTVLLLDSYSLSATITGAPGIKLQGRHVDHNTCGTTGSTITNTGTGAAITFTGDGSQANSSNFIVEGLRIIGNASSSHGVSITSGQLCEVKYCHIYSHGGAGVCINAGIENTIEKNRIQDCKNNVEIENHATTVYIDKNRIEDCNDGTAGVKITNSDLLSIKDNAIESNDGKGVWLVGPVIQTEIVNNWFELNDQVDSGDEDIYIQGTSGNTMAGLYVARNRINSSGVSMAIKVEYTDDSVFFDNRCGHATPTSISFDANSSDNLVLWNRFAGTYTDKGTNNIRNERSIVNELGSNCKLRGNLNLNDNLLRDTTHTTATFGWETSGPESSVTAPAGSLRCVSGNGMTYTKHTGSGNTGWALLAPIIVKTDTGDPSSDLVEGLICINTFDNNVKIYAESAWRQLVTW